VVHSLKNLTLFQVFARAPVWAHCCLSIILYPSRLFEIIETQIPNVHCYADDTQLYLPFVLVLHLTRPRHFLPWRVAYILCVLFLYVVSNWMLSNGLMLNDSKTEFIITGSRQQLAKMNTGSINFGMSNISPASGVRNLGAWFDANTTMAPHITKTCATAFYFSHNVRTVRKYLTRQCTETLIHSFITSRLDYCNTLHYGLPDIHINELQRVQNSCARLFCIKATKYCHVATLLFDLHWVPVRFRIDFKILLLTYVPTINLLLAIRFVTLKTMLGDRAFEFAAPKLWNALPSHIRTCINVNLLIFFQRMSRGSIDG